MTSVVKMWRGRAELTGRTAWKCSGCGVLTLVRRRKCGACGAVGVPSERAPLPRATVRAVTAAGASVEHLDQVTGRKPSVFLELDGGLGRLACLLQYADSVTLLPQLRGASVRLAVRRVPLGPLPPGEPIPYALKAALDLSTRLSLKPAKNTPAPDGAATK
jgi:hypothetical protein